MLRRRADNYHDLETVFYRLRWSDSLHVCPAPEFTLTCSGIPLPTDETNLVTKAARALSAGGGAALHLEKVLPAGAGLGGGSSDAAAALQLLAEFWDLDLSNAALREVAMDLGSDVSFFLGPPIAYATGRGEVLTPMKDYRLPFTLVVAVPPVHVSTSWAFAQIRPCAARRPDIGAVVRSNDLCRWRAELKNDFEPVVLEVWSVLREAKSLLLYHGAGYASLSGTGAAVFGLFEDAAHADSAAAEARHLGWMVWCEDQGVGA